jgi:hypothetical protein
MNESSPSDSRATPIFGGRAAFGLGAMQLAGFVLVLALATFDRQRRVQIEGWEEVTAVGDRAFFVPPADSAAPAVLSWDAGTLTVAAGERTEIRDTQMRRAGRDQSAGIAIYRHAAPGKAEAAGGFYVKVAPGEYLLAK